MTKNHFSDSAYLKLLAERTRAGLENLPREILSRHEAAVLRFRTKEGGFRGRRRGADLYYTAFAARVLHALGAFPVARDGGGLRPSTASLQDETSDGLSQSISHYITQQEPQTIIDALDLLNISLLLGGSPIEPMRRLEFIESFRSTDGGYGKRTNAAVGSLYHSFLAVLCYNLLGVEPPEQDRLVEFTINHRRPDGGFSELSAGTGRRPYKLRQSSTNATAAGLALLSVLGALSEDVADGVASYLLSMQHGSGGWFASKSVPLPDLLSAYTALVSLKNIQRLEPTVLAKALAFVRMCEGQDGGFSAGPWDGTVDVEYTYYGLGIIAFARSI